MTLIDAPPDRFPASERRRARAAQLAELHRHLDDQHRRLVAELETLTVDADVSDLFDSDVAVGCGTDREITHLLVDQLASRRAEVVAARRRLAEGTYGWCTSCADQIAEERLEILPAAPTCVRCAPTRC